MSRLQCIGTSSKVPSQDAEAAEPGILSSRDAPVTKSVQAKTQLQKTKLRARPEGQQPSAITERRRDKGNVDKSETQAGVQVLSPTDTTTHRQEQSHTETHSAPVGAEEKTVSSECVQKMREPLLQVPRCLGVPKCGAGRSSSEAESGDEEECEEEEEDADEFRAPIELLAEFLKAVMEKKYTLAKKLCQMILIYEPENPEAKHFLPLIEERLLIEEAQKGSSGEDDTSDDDDDDDDDDNDDDESSSSGSGDDDDDDDDTDTCTDSDGDGRKEEDISQR
ncbi:glutamate-rich protein 2 isoform X3 [Pangasianodon hypophthalmus]|uniref:glutamate-rich protein 2 isoform X3 n=1 Tax=Pangasianodon hypophthalmus TaxID=310915 RepID=UPI000F00E8ED|nr:glutamate-rich protein 2 isoform X3 [Pangasianodon hypophthalmus]